MVNSVINHDSVVGGHIAMVQSQCASTILCRKNTAISSVASTFYLHRTLYLNLHRFITIKLKTERYTLIEQPVNIVGLHYIK